MTELHLITPPPELIEEWIELSRPQKGRFPNPNVLATYAASWGANRELQFCLDWFQEFYKGETWMHKDLKIFMAARRPAPPSLKQQSIALIDKIQKSKEAWDVSELNVIREALKSLPD